jgi:hypothetical protein
MTPLSARRPASARPAPPTHADLAKITRPRYLQCYAFGSKIREGGSGRFLGHTVVTGRLPVPEATAEQLLSSAHRALSNLRPIPPHLSNLLEHGDSQLARELRYLRTEVWPTLYHVLIIRHGDPSRVWGLPKPQAIALLPTDEPLGSTIRSFYAALWSHYNKPETVESALDCIAKGVAFLRAAKDWYDAR